MASRYSLSIRLIRNTHADAARIPASTRSISFVEQPDPLFEVGRCFLRRKVDQVAHGRHKLGRLAARCGNHLPQRVHELLAAGAGDAVGGALGTAAVSARRHRFDQPRPLQAANGVVERAALERKNFVLVPFMQQALHLVGMHRGLAQGGKNGNLPDSKIHLHIA